MHILTASSDCPPSWKSGLNGDFCYKLLDVEHTWSDAQRECNSQYANLASFSSEAEFDFVKSGMWYLIVISYTNRSSSLVLYAFFVGKTQTETPSQWPYTVTVPACLSEHFTLYRIR